MIFLASRGPTNILWDIKVSSKFRRTFRPVPRHIQNVFDGKMKGVSHICMIMPIELRLSAHFCQNGQKLTWAHFWPQNLRLEWLKCFWKASECVWLFKTNPKHIWIEFIRPKAALLSQLEHGHESRKICLQKGLKMSYAWATPWLRLYHFL